MVAYILQVFQTRILAFYHGRVVRTFVLTTLTCNDSSLIYPIAE